MNIESLSLCRADQKVFEHVRVHVDAGATEARLASVSSAAEKTLPVEVVPYHNGYVLIYPDQHVGVGYLKLQLIAADGQLLDTVLLARDFSKIKWTSRLNYRIKTAEVMAYRGINWLNQRPLFSGCTTYAAPLCGIQHASITLERIVLDWPSHERIFDLHLEVVSSRTKQLTLKLASLDGKTVVDCGIDTGTQTTVDKATGHTTVISNQSFRVGEFVHGVVGLLVDETGCVLAHEEFSLDLIDRLIRKYEESVRTAQNDPCYDQWVRRLHLKPAECAAQRAEVAAMEHKPGFSIVVPVFNPPVDVFCEMLDSVLAQTYDNWELLLINACMDNQVIKQVIQNYAARDSRITELPLTQNQGIWLNTKVGIDAAQLDFVSFLDHDDIIEPNLFFEYAQAVAHHSTIDMLYCDEDIYKGGRFTSAFTKPDFDVWHLRQSNYICHLLTVRRELLNSLEVDGARYDGAQDHNLSLMISEHARTIWHVRKTLYHWRAVEGSTADEGSNKEYAWDAGVRAVTDHLKRLGLPAQPQRAGLYFVTDPNVMLDKDYRPRVTLLVSVDQATLCDGFAERLQATLDAAGYDEVQVLVALLGATNQTEFAAKLSSMLPARAKLLDHPSWSELNNALVGDVVVHLSGNAQVTTHQWLARMLSYAQVDSVGAVGCKVIYSDQTIKNAGYALVGSHAKDLFRNSPTHLGTYHFYDHLTRSLSAVSGECLLVHTQVLKEALVHMLAFKQQTATNTVDNLLSSDVDLCMHIKDLGKEIIYLPKVEAESFQFAPHGPQDGEKTWDSSLRPEGWVDPSYSVVYSQPQRLTYHAS